MHQKHFKQIGITNKQIVNKYWCVGGIQVQGRQGDQSLRNTNRIVSTMGPIPWLSLPPIPSIFTFSAVSSQIIMFTFKSIWYKYPQTLLLDRIVSTVEAIPWLRLPLIPSTFTFTFYKISTRKCCLCKRNYKYQVCTLPSPTSSYCSWTRTIFFTLQSKLPSCFIISSSYDHKILSYHHLIVIFSVWVNSW